MIHIPCPPMENLTGRVLRGLSVKHVYTMNSVMVSVLHLLVGEKQGLKD